MKPIILFAVVLLTGTNLSLYADPPAPVTQLMDKLAKACQSQDIPAIKSLYDLDGVPQALVDQHLSMWQEVFNQNDKTSHWAYQTLKYTSLADILADKKMNQTAILEMTKPRTIGENVYGPNLEVMGFITATFKQGAGEMGQMLPIGYAADGTAKIAADCPAK